MNLFEQKNDAAPWQLPELHAGHNVARLLPSREQTDGAENELIREFNDPSWNQDVQEARALLKTLTVRGAGTPVHRLYDSIIDSDAIMYGAALLSTGAVAACASVILDLPLAPVAVVSGGIMALAVTLIQRLHRIG
ncbi:MAG: hypothetical protein VX874_15990 [Pseudomonadota bacterium]|nr:hypothetical protein [Pseudomonadota bacterium]